MYGNSFWDSCMGTRTLLCYVVETLIEYSSEDAVSDTERFLTLRTSIYVWSCRNGYEHNQADYRSYVRSLSDREGTHDGVG